MLPPFKVIGKKTAHKFTRTGREKEPLMDERAQQISVKLQWVREWRYFTEWQKPQHQLGFCCPPLRNEYSQTVLQTLRRNTLAGRPCHIYLQLISLLSQKQLLIPKPVCSSHTCFYNYVIQFNINKPNKIQLWKRNCFIKTKLNALKDSTKTDHYFFFKFRGVPDEKL